MKHDKQPIFAIFVATVTLSLGGCANFSSFQEADTMAAGQHRKGVGASVTKYKFDLGDTEEDVTVPALNLWYRIGLTDRFELHAMAWIPLGATIGGKYQLLGNRNKAGLALSLGLDAGYLTITSGDAGNETKTTIVDTYVPVYLGYRTSPGFAAYLVPKYMLRFTNSDSGSDLVHFTGGTVGVAIGKSSSFHIEGSALVDINSGDPAITGGIGFAF